MKLSPWLSKLNHLLLSAVFYLLNCRQCRCFDCWVCVPVIIELTHGLFPGFRHIEAVTFKVTKLSASETFCHCPCCIDIHRHTASSVHCPCCHFLLQCVCRHLTTLLGHGRLLCLQFGINSPSHSSFCLLETVVIVHME